MAKTMLYGIIALVAIIAVWALFVRKKGVKKVMGEVDAAAEAAAATAAAAADMAVSQWQSSGTIQSQIGMNTAMSQAELAAWHAQNAQNTEDYVVAQAEAAAAAIAASSAVIAADAAIEAAEATFNELTETINDLNNERTTLIAEKTSWKNKRDYLISWFAGTCKWDRSFWGAPKHPANKATRSKKVAKSTCHSNRDKYFSYINHMARVDREIGLVDIELAVLNDILLGLATT